MDDIRRSNSRDAALVEMPMCPRCHASNAPWQSPVIERVGRVYFCTVCALEFKPVDA